MPEDKAEEIDNLGIIAYVKDEVKARRHLADENWIRNFPTFQEILERCDFSSERHAPKESGGTGLHFTEVLWARHLEQ